MSRPIVTRIHRRALSQNLSRIRHLHPDSKIFAVVKANAYGHGIQNVYASFQSADGFALLDIAEARILRDLGWRGPILLLEGCFDARDLEACSRLNLWHTIHNEAQIEWLSAHKTPNPHHVFLKLNSGMNRLGFSTSMYRSAHARLSALVQVDEISHMTHFANADAEHPANSAKGVEHAFKLFDSCSQDIGGEESICNSAAALRSKQIPAVAKHVGDWLRPGIALYGCSPDFPQSTAKDWGLQAAMTLESKIIAVQQLSAGDSVGYGSTFTAQQPMRIGIVACGYADGYPRHAPTGTPVLVNGVRTITIGRVSMDMLAVDITDLGNAVFGSIVTLWGNSPNGQTLSIDEVAASASTISYELMCALAQRVPIELID